MNYSESEDSGIRTDDDAIIEAGMALLPVLGRALYCPITELAHAHRLTPAQAKVLLQVGRHGQSTISEVAAGLMISMPAASEIVDRLVDAGHLVRASDPADRRRVLIAATPRAMGISAEMDDLRRAQLRHAVEQLTPKERPSFVRVLEALVTGLSARKAADAEQCPGPAAGDSSLAPAGSLPRPTPEMGVGANADSNGKNARVPTPNRARRGLER
jgi:DNA-binding MarR family transcriptional regulator